MTAAGRSRRLAAALAIATLTAGSMAQDQLPRIVALNADPSSAREGDYVTFRAEVQNPSGSLLNHGWDLGDGTLVEGVVHLDGYRHRYRDEGSYTVTFSVGLPDGGGDRRTVTLLVENVAPEVRAIERSADPLPGAPVTFTAAVVDPGDDDLELVWDFGDGTDPVTRRNRRAVEHTYERPGSYALRLTVRDGDGGEAVFDEVVLVGRGFTYRAGGSIALPERTAPRPALTGLPVDPRADGTFALRADMGRILAGENPAEGTGPCLVVLGNRSPAMFTAALEPGLLLQFSAVLPAGLEEGTYPIAVQRNEAIIVARQPWEEQLANPGVFFLQAAELVPSDDPRDPLPDADEFHGAGGTLTIHRYDGQRLEATFEALLEESRSGTPAGADAPSPRTATVSGAVAHDVNRSVFQGEGSLDALTGAGFGDWYLCDGGGDVAVVDHDMGSADDAADPSAPVVAGQPGLVNLPWEHEAYATDTAKLEFTFDRPMAAASLNDRTVVLEVYQTSFAATGEPFHQVFGSVVAIDDTTYRFFPYDDLRPGVIYRMTVRGGEEGVRGAAGETLAEDYGWTFATRVEFWISPHTFQTALDAPLVPGKATLTRVYAHWPRHADLPVESHVASFEADVTVTVDGAEAYPPKRGVTLRWMDLLTAEERRAGEGSVNFFGWRPTRTSGSSRLEVTVEPTGQPQPEPVRTTGGRTVTHWGRAPTLTFDYHFLTVGSWADGVPDGLRRTGHRIAQDGAVFMTQNFPVVDTVARPRGGLTIPIPSAYGGDAAGWNCATLAFDYSLDGDPTLNRWQDVAMHVAWEVLQATRASDADAVVAIVPPELGEACGWLGIMLFFPPLGLVENLAITEIADLGTRFAEDPSTKRVILIRGDATGPVLAHEFGHYLGLCHPGSADRPGCVAAALVNEGYRIARDGGRGWNKSDVEGNGEGPSADVLPLMEPQLALDDRRYFVGNQHYARLQENFDLLMRAAAARPASAAPVGGPVGDGVVLAQGVPSATPNLAVRGWIAPDGALARVTSLRPTSAPPTPDTGGAVVVAVRDAAGRELAVVRTDPLAVGITDAPVPEVLPRYVDVVLPAPADAGAVSFAVAGRELARVDRSAHAPQLALELDGTSLRWVASDRDGDALVFDVAYAADGAAWSPLTSSTVATSLRLPDALEPGPLPSLRVIASDGFHAVEAVVALAPAPGLRPVVTTPEDGADLAPDGSLWVIFNGELAHRDLPGDAFTLQDAAGARVAATTSVIAGGRGLLLVPEAALAPGTYRATVAGVRASAGPGLDAPVVWSVAVGVGAAVTAPGDAAAEGAGDDPAAAVAAPASLPATCAGIDAARVAVLLPERHELLAVGDGATCVVDARSPIGLEQVRSGLEVALLRNRLLPTRNARDGDDVVIAFEGGGLRGEARLVPDGPGTRVRLEVGPQ